MQMHLVGPPVVGETGDPLERFYTPDTLAAACLDRLPDLPDLPVGATVLEPSCGGGAFVRAARKRWPGVRVLGFDLDPEAPGLRMVDEHVVGDFLERTPAGVDLVFGNPPFGPALRHVEHALQVAERVAFLLPLGRIEGGGDWGPWLDRHPPEAVHPIAGRPWPRSVRGCGFWIWGPEPGAYTIHPRITDWR